MNRIESLTTGRQDVCCGPTSFACFPLHLPLFAFSSKGALALRGIHSLPRRHTSSTNGGGMTDDQPANPVARGRGKPITDEENAKIALGAKETGVTDSAYFRTRALNTP